MIVTSAVAVPPMPVSGLFAGAGWVDFDPTNGVVGNRDLVRVAVARDPRQAMPLTGAWYGPVEASLGMSVGVIVRRADEVGTGANL